MLRPTISRQSELATTQATTPTQRKYKYLSWFHPHTEVNNTQYQKTPQSRE
jgi:hypothetical protein